MAPQEKTGLLSNKTLEVLPLQESFSSSDNNKPSRHFRAVLIVLGTLLALGLGAVVAYVVSTRHEVVYRTGPYRLVELQTGADFFGYYDFMDGPDSLGSNGYNRYVSKRRAQTLGIARVDPDGVYMASSAGSQEKYRESIRLEGKRRFHSGLFVLQLSHMPTGCGVWPAWWLTDETHWPDHGEIDIVEGINTQTVAKTALHTSDRCDMYAHVPTYNKTGHWDSATGIPDTWTGALDVETHVPADNCWVLAPHQWENQGCVTISDRNDTLGAPLNAAGGGTFVLEWDPANHHIKSWVFRNDGGGIPDNLQQAMMTSGSGSANHPAHTNNPVEPDPFTWGLPYAYFAIGEKTGCSADHFFNHHLIFNLAFCGTVAGNRFVTDCPTEAHQFAVLRHDGSIDPVATCNAFVASNPPSLEEEAYWKIQGIYIYQRT